MNDVNAPENREFMESAVNSWEGRTQLIYGEPLEFDEENHHYKWANKPVPGVTTILSVIGKPALVPWAAGCASDHWLSEIKLGKTDYSAIHKAAKSAHRKKAGAAADIGKNVHEYAECYAKGMVLPVLLTDQAKLGVEAFHKWIDAHKVKFIASERRVFSKEHYYAGTIDIVAFIDGKLVVGDFKTSSGIYREMLMQTAAYQKALSEEKGEIFSHRVIVRFDKKSGNFETRDLYDFDRDFSGFKAALELHRVIQSMSDEK